MQKNILHFGDTKRRHEQELMWSIFPPKIITPGILTSGNFLSGNLHFVLIVCLFYCSVIRTPILETMIWFRVLEDLLLSYVL